MMEGLTAVSSNNKRSFWQTLFWGGPTPGPVACGEVISNPDPVCIADPARTPRLKPSSDETPIITEKNKNIWVDPNNPTSKIKRSAYESKEGVTLTWKFQAANCDSSNNNLYATVTYIDSHGNYRNLGDKYPAVNNEITITATFTKETWPNNNSLNGTLHYWDPIGEKEMTLTFRLWIPLEEEGACYSVLQPSTSLRTPANVSEIVKGDNTIFSWTVVGLTDCHGEPLILTSHNEGEILNNASLNYEEGILTVTGQIKPSIDSGTIKVNFKDANGNSKIINLYLPTIKPLELATADPFIQQNENVSFYLIQEPAGATNYRFRVTKPDGSDDPEANQLNSNYTYQPTQVGVHILNLEVTTYNSEIISTSYPFFVNVWSKPTPEPSVAISGPYSAYLGEKVDLTGNSDDPNATYEWTITPPSGSIITVSGQSLVDFELNQIGDWDFKLTVTGADGLTKNSKLHPISVYPLSSAIPSAVISSNLKYSYHRGDTVTNITGYSDDPNATFNWTITRPDGVIETYTNMQTISSYTFNLDGDYDFKLEVVGADGQTKNYETRSVGVYPPSVTTPQASIFAPFAAKVGEGINFVAANADETTYSYTWIYGDGTTGSGANPMPKSFTQSGTYTVKLIVTRRDDPTIKDEATQKITIVPQSIDPPALSLLAKFSEQVNIPVTMTVANPDTNNWSYTWEYGDGSPTGSGTNVSHAYTNPGTYTIKLTATSILDPTVRYIVTQTITIVPQGDPVPNLEINPGIGPAPLTVTASAANSYATAPGATIDNYTFNWGDGSPEESGSQSSRNHTFTCGSSSCAYTIRLKIRDSNNKESAITATVATWQQ